jgi:hypothetical protein
VAVAGINPVTPPGAIGERAMPHDLGGTVIRLAVRGWSFHQTEASARHHFKRVRVVGGSHQIGVPTDRAA